MKPVCLMHYRLLLTNKMPKAIARITGALRVLKMFLTSASACLPVVARRSLALMPSVTLPTITSSKTIRLCSGSYRQISFGNKPLRSLAVLRKKTAVSLTPTLTGRSTFMISRTFHTSGRRILWIGSISLLPPSPPSVSRAKTDARSTEQANL